MAGTNQIKLSTDIHITVTIGFLPPSPLYSLLEGEKKKERKGKKQLIVTNDNSYNRRKKKLISS